jgi:hypothetical protein
MKSGVVADAGLSWVFSPDAIVSKVQEKPTMAQSTRSNFSGLSSCPPRALNAAVKFTGLPHAR